MNCVMSLYGVQIPKQNYEIYDKKVWYKQCHKGKTVEIYAGDQGLQNKPNDYITQESYLSGKITDMSQYTVL